MAQGIRKFGIILAVAVLYAIFVFALGDAITGEVTYPDICEESKQDSIYARPPYPAEKVNCTELPPPTQEEIDACPGQLNPDYRTACPEGYVCNCWMLQEQFNQHKRDVMFWVAVVLGFLAIALGMLLPEKNELNEWVGGGFIIGGLISLFIATAMYWQVINKIARPVVIALELVLVLWIAYKKFGQKTKKPVKK